MTCTRPRGRPNTGSKRACTRSAMTASRRASASSPWCAWMSKCAVRVVLKRNRGSERSAARAVDAARISSTAASETLTRAIAEDILEEREIGDRGEAHAMDVRLEYGNIRFVPQRDVGDVTRDQLLHLSVESPPLFVVHCGRRGVDEAIDLTVHVVDAIEAGQRHLRRMEDAPQHVGIGDADKLRRVHLEVALDHVALQRGELLRPDIERDAHAREVLLDGRGLDAVDL